MHLEEIVPAFMGTLRKTLATIYDSQLSSEDSKQRHHISHTQYSNMTQWTGGKANTTNTANTQP
jgi:hypothetical protein